MEIQKFTMFDGELNSNDIVLATCEFQKDDFMCKCRIITCFDELGFVEECNPEYKVEAKFNKKNGKEYTYELFDGVCKEIDEQRFKKIFQMACDDCYEMYIKSRRTRKNDLF